MRIRAVVLAVGALLASAVAFHCRRARRVEAARSRWSGHGCCPRSSEQRQASRFARVMNPVGMLIQAANGYVLQIVSQSARPATLNAAEQFMTYRAFWGTFTIEPSGAKANYHIDGDLDPGRKDQRFTTSFERKGRSSCMTELSADGRPVQRTTWERLPELEALPDYLEPVVGMWQWTGAGLYNAAGENLQPANRDASLIVYTPTGHMAVLYLPTARTQAVRRSDAHRRRGARRLAGLSVVSSAPTSSNQRVGRCFITSLPPRTPRRWADGSCATSR